MVRGVPSMCMRQQSTSWSATTPASSGSPRNAVTSLTKLAPAASAAAATSAFEVSIDSCAPVAASPSITGRTRRSSSSAGTGSAPGRVDSPPMSRISAPSAARRSPWATASPASRKRPPSENESGVTLTTPIRVKLTPVKLADLRARERGAERGDLGDGRGDVGGVPHFDLALEIVDVGGHVGQAPRHGGGTLGLEGLELGAKLDRRHDGCTVPAGRGAAYGGELASGGEATHTGGSGQQVLL